MFFSFATRRDGEPARARRAPRDDGARNSPPGGDERGSIGARATRDRGVAGTFGTPSSDASKKGNAGERGRFLRRLRCLRRETRIVVRRAASRRSSDTSALKNTRSLASLRKPSLSTRARSSLAATPSSFGTVRLWLNTRALAGGWLTRGWGGTRRPSRRRSAPGARSSRARWSRR